MDVVEELKLKVAFVFPGQGSHYVGMGKDLYESSPAARNIFQQAEEVLGMALSRMVFEGPAEELEDTENQQPAILTVSVACLSALRERLEELGQRLQPIYLAGHSLGQFTAMVAADGLDFAKALELVRERGRLMKESGRQRPGGMAAILGLEREKVQEICEKASRRGVVAVANHNSLLQTVISGDLASLRQAIDLAKEMGARQAVRLAISIAAHSPLMEWAGKQFAELVASLELQDARIPIVSNIDGRPLLSTRDLRRELSEQMCQPVQWYDSVTRMVDEGVQTFVEVGPGKVLSGLIKRIDGDVKAISYAELAGNPQLLWR